MTFEELDKEIQQAILEKAQYLIDEGYETDDSEIVKNKIFNIIINNKENS